MVACAATLASLGAVASLAALAATASCGGSRGTRLDNAGGERDEGAGELALASQRLLTAADGSNSERFAVDVRGAGRWDVPYASPYAGIGYGGFGYGGAAYGGASYANWTIPQWSSTPQSRAQRYTPTSGLDGAVEGTVTWLGPPPTKLASACGPVDNPTLRVGNDKAARGVVVYIEKVAVGRAVPYYTRPIVVGGTVAKRGCSLVPAAQIVAPAPGPLAIHGDRERVKLRVTSPALVAASVDPDGSPDGAADDDDADNADTTTLSASRPRARPAPATTPVAKPIVTTHDLQEGGVIQVAARPGVTRVESDDGKTSAAWIIGLETPYYAITDDAGRFRIDELPMGSYELTFWQAPVASVGPGGTWTYSAPSITRRNVTIGAKTAQLSIALTPSR